MMIAKYVVYLKSYIDGSDTFVLEWITRGVFDTIQDAIKEIGSEDFPHHYTDLVIVMEPRRA